MLWSISPYSFFSYRLPNLPGISLTIGCKNGLRGRFWVAVVFENHSRDESREDADERAGDDVAWPMNAGLNSGNRKIECRKVKKNARFWIVAPTMAASAKKKTA